MLQKNYLPGGIILCVFPAIVFFVVRANADSLPLWGIILLGYLFVHGLWAITMTVFKLDSEGAASWFMGSFSAVSFGVMALVVAWQEKAGWSGIPFVPDAWNSIIARIGFALASVVGFLLAVLFFRKALRRLKRRD